MDKQQNTNNPLENIQSYDWNKERLETLKKLYPDLFVNEGKVDVREIAKLMDYASVNEVERYEFRWFGKSHAKREAFTPTDATFVYDETKSVHPSKSENLIIEGENLAVLKLLSNGYREQIKCIYIDPPYNTGKDFVYSDSWKQDKKEYWEDAEMTENGYKIDSNTETNGRFHSNWLNMMYSRLLIARQLLKEDGVIFISIDDHEVHHLRKICDEVFGENNFVSEFIWQKNFAPKNDNKYISNSHEYILHYAKDKNQYKRNLLKREDKHNKDYKNPDNDPKGLWTSGSMLATSFNQNGVFEIISHNNKHLPPKGRCWRFSLDKVEELKSENKLWFGTGGHGVPRIKRYLSDMPDGIVPQTWLDYKLVGSGQDGTQSSKFLFDNAVYFDFPKPSTLIKHLLTIGTRNTDIILDFFAGSGTTGQAVTELNQEDGGNRQYILVQLPEQTAENSEAFKAGYKKISDITIERNKRVIEKIIQEKKEATPHLFSQEESQEKQLKGLGFKVFKLQKSNFPRVEYAPDLEKTTKENIELLKKYIRDKEAQLVSVFNRDELITEILIKKGFKLNYTLTKQEQFKGNEILFATDGDKETLICLDVIIAEETVAYFKTHTEQKLIVLERALDTTKKWNLKHTMGNKFDTF